MEILEFAEACLTRPSDFGYHGRLDLFNTWAIIPISQHRDSDAMERSNFRVALDALKGTATADDKDQAEESDEYVQTLAASHWGHGWVEHIVVRVLNDSDGGLTEDNITHTFRRAFELFDALQDYPLLSESDYSELESEESQEAFESEWARVDWDEYSPQGEPSEEVKWQLYDYMCQDADGYPESFWSEDITSEYVKWCERIAHEMNYGPGPGQLNLNLF